MGVEDRLSCSIGFGQLVSDYGQGPVGPHGKFEVPVSPEDAVGYFEYIEGPETDALSYGIPNPLPPMDREAVLGTSFLDTPFQKANRFNTIEGNIPPFDIDGDGVKKPGPGPDDALLEYIGRFGSDDRLVGDVDDVLLFTTRSSGACILWETG